MGPNRSHLIYYYHYTMIYILFINCVTNVRINTYLDQIWRQTPAFFISFHIWSCTAWTGINSKWERCWEWRHDSSTGNVKIKWNLCWECRYEYWSGVGNWDMKVGWLWEWRQNYPVEFSKTETLKLNFKSNGNYYLGI